MANPVAIRADEVAFPSLLKVSRQRPSEPTEAELFLRPVAVMKLEGGSAERVAAVHTLATNLRDQLSLALLAMLLLPSVCLRIALASAVLDKLITRGKFRGRLRSVMHAKRRTVETEPSPIQVMKLTVGEHSRRKRRAASLTRLVGYRSHHALARRRQGTMRKTLKTPLSTAEVEPTATCDPDNRERLAALRADQHCRTLVLSWTVGQDYP